MSLNSAKLHCNAEIHLEPCLPLTMFANNEKIKSEQFRFLDF